jgi:hypothetical protein
MLKPPPAPQSISGIQINSIFFSLKKQKLKGLAIFYALVGSNGRGLDL